MMTPQPCPGLPPLAGLTTFAEAARPGLSVEACVTRLKRLHYVLRRLHGVFVARLTAEPLHELKMAFSLHAHYCAEHVAALRRRVGEMREPPLGLEETPHAGLEVFLDEVLGAPTTGELVLGLYDRALPAVRAAMRRHLADTNVLADHPTVRVLRFALLEVEEMLEFGGRAVEALEALEAAEGGGPGGLRARAAGWLGRLDAALAAAGGLDGTAAEPWPALPGRLHSARPHEYDPVPRRDARFPDPYNMGVNAEAFLYDPSFAAEPKTLMMFYKRLREIDVPEMMAGILAQTPGKPWEYYRDMTRQLWDEARHALMGEVGFVALGIDWPRCVRVNFTWSLALNTQLTPLERHAVLYYIEQGLMPRTGKRFEWEVGLASHNPLSALFQDYDWADEVLHARIGRDWYLPAFADAKAAVRYGDECWSKVLLNWEAWRREGRTEHRNWWPDLYRAACVAWGIEPDPAVLAYATSYEKVRADLKELTGSG
ncbi:MAG: hypothetical protein RJA22_2889 [Verrucomicrobiota bacterium]